MKTFRLLAFIMVICLAVGLVGICGTPVAGDYSNTVSFSEGEIKIVRPEGDEACIDLSKQLFGELKDKLGVSANCIDDSDSADGKEILVGKTNRIETEHALYLLNSLGDGYDDDFIICENGGKICVVGNSDESTAKAVECFVDNYLCLGEMEVNTYYADVLNASYTSTIKINGTKITSYNCSIVTPLYNMSYITRIQLDKLTAALKTNTGYTFNEYTDEKAPALNLDGSIYEGLVEHTRYGEQLPVNFANEDDIHNWEKFYAWYTKLSKTKTVYDPPGSYEIVIGDCNRIDCPKITDPYEYQIKVYGNRIFLNGGSPYATAMAVSEFTKMVNSGSLTLTNDSSFTGDYNNAISSYDRSSYYTLAWGDDFNGTEIDEAKWKISYDDENVYALGLNGRENYRASKELKNNYVKDGKFYIDAVYTDEAYYGGMLITNNTMRYKYGYIESSSLLPMGQGFWTSLWLSSDLGENGLAYTEIDVNECYGASHYVYGNTFSHLSAGVQKYFTTVLNYSEKRTQFHYNNRYFSTDTRGHYLDFHTYGYEWDEEYVRFTCDGKVYKEHKYTENFVITQTTHNYYPYEVPCTVDAFSAPNYLRLSMALGFSSRGYVAKDDDVCWDEYGQYITDYVHIYQYDNQKTYIYKSNNKTGDINADGSVDMLDSAHMARYLAAWTKYDFSHLDLGAGDMDDDGLVTNKDLIMLNELLAAHGGYWGDDNVPSDTEVDDSEWLPWL